VQKQRRFVILFSLCQQGKNALRCEFGWGLLYIWFIRSGNVGCGRKKVYNAVRYEEFCGVGRFFYWVVVMILVWCWAVFVSGCGGLAFAADVVGLAIL
jgi:hypothetical protein